MEEKKLAKTILLISYQLHHTGGVYAGWHNEEDALHCLLTLYLFIPACACTAGVKRLVMASIYSTGVSILWILMLLECQSSLLDTWLIWSYVRVCNLKPYFVWQQSRKCLFFTLPELLSFGRAGIWSIAEFRPHHGQAVTKILCLSCWWIIIMSINNNNSTSLVAWITLI